MILMKVPLLKLISAFVPYVSVLIGLYIFRNAWISIGLYHLGMTAFLMTDTRGASLKTACSGWNPAAAVFGIALSVMIFPVIWFFWKYMELGSIPLNAVLANLGLQGTSWLFFMIYFSTVQPVLEELFWRGYLGCGGLRGLWTDAAFAGYHILVLAQFFKVPWLVIAFAILTMVAFIWRSMTSKLKGLRVPILSHIAADISIIVAIDTLRRLSE